MLIAAEYPIYGRFGYGPAVCGAAWELDAAATPTYAGEGTIQFVDHGDVPQGGAGRVRPGPRWPARA